MSPLAMPSRRGALALLLSAAGAAGIPAGAAPAQDLAARVPAASREDSVRALRAARSRQAAFERTRRAHLDETWGGGGGPCDERIGRFCLTYSEDDQPEWEPPEEPEAIGRSRERLLDELAASAAAIPGDAWVVGQRVRYLIEAGRYDGAAEAAASCRAAAWWCHALTGFAAHYRGDPAPAHAAFQAMLAAMPDELREEWSDLSLLLDGAARRYYRRLPVTERGAYEERFWRLADPLAATEGNDARSEHFSRHLLVRLQERAETTDDLPWGNDLREILLRFGFPAGWERVRSAYPYALGERASLISHYPEADIDLIPPVALLGDSFAPVGVDWTDEHRRSRASYPLPRAGERLRWIDPFDFQVALFREGDSTAVVAAWELPADSVAPDAPVDAALAIWSDFAEPRVVARERGAGRTGLLLGAAPAGPLLLSLEAELPRAKRAARVRLGAELSPPSAAGLALSDLLLFRPPGEALPERRAEAAAQARASTRAQPGERIGVYWEIYAPADAPSRVLEVSLRLVEMEVGMLRRLGRRLGVVSVVQPIRLAWSEGTDRQPGHGRSLALEIPATLRPGSYAVELSVRAEGEDPLLARRTLRIGS